MRSPLSLAGAARIALGLTVVVGSAVLLSSTDKPAFTEVDKAYYADASLASYVRPGLTLQIVPQGTGIKSDGTITAHIKIADPKGVPLDKDGVTTPGAVPLRFVVAYIPPNQTQYVSYLTRKAVSKSGVSADQATYDSAGTYQTIGTGDYIYTFKAKAQSVNRAITHTIGLWGARDLTEFGLSSYPASNTFNFVPSGAPVTVTRDVVKTQSCNRCHDPLSAHDERQGMDLCVMCHTPQTVDPDTGNTMDMAVMVHKIHDGPNLPSFTKDHKPYQIIGYQGAVSDFSKITFPTDVRNCTICHEQNIGAAQAANYTKPTTAACTSCHDDVNMASGKNHADGLPVTDEKQCARCHLPTSTDGSVDFASVTGGHTIPTTSPDLKGVVFQLTGIDNGQAGKNPTVHFTARNKAGQPLELKDLNRLSLVLAGPTTDYAQYWSENALATAQGSAGTFTYTFTNAIPADAKGSYTIGIEGYKSVTLYPGTTHETANVRDAAMNVTMDFSVDGSPVQARRTVVSLEQCNQCHFQLSLHGGNRNTIQQCVLCHNPNTTDKAQRSAEQMPAESVDFRMMVHRLHVGEERTAFFNLPAYVIYGNGKRANDFSEITYPGNLAKCAKCHVNGSNQLPLKPGLLDVQDARGYLNPVGPQTAACVSCHQSLDASSHALVNTSKLGESCSVCHGPNAEAAVSKVHAQ